MVRGLAVPDGAIARGFDGGDRKPRVPRLDLLQARDVGLRFGKPFQQARQPPVDAVDVEGGDLQAVVLPARGAPAARCSVNTKLTPPASLRASMVPPIFPM